MANTKLLQVMDLEVESWKRGFRDAMAGEANRRQYAADSEEYSSGYRAGQGGTK